MNRLLWISFLINIIGLNMTFATSGGAGNGGDAIVCPDREVRVMLLDSYEARDIRKQTLSLVNPKLDKQTWRSMVNVAVKRLDRVDSHTASMLYDYAMAMVNDFEKFVIYPNKRGKHVYLGTDVNTKINDSEHISIPADCEQEPRQMIIQRAPKFKLAFRFHFNKTFWDQLTLQDQAMAILHEAWYQIMIENGATNSIAARYMNGLIASVEFEKYSFSDYLDELKETELKKYTVLIDSDVVKDKELIIDLENDELGIKDDQVCVTDTKINMSIKLRQNILNNKPRYLTKTNYKSICFKNSKLTSVTLTSKTAKAKIVIRLPYHQVYINHATNEFPTVHFDENGKLTGLSGLDFSMVMEMYYICNGRRTYRGPIKCEEGPYIQHKTEIKNPKTINFNSSEVPLQFAKKILN